MSNKEKDADDGENIILSVTCDRDENEKPVIEEEWAVPRVPGLHFRGGEAVILPDFLPLPRSDVVSAADALGRDIQTERLIAIGEEERCGGLYILGQPRTGKSNLLVSLALSDIRRNHGILFIDPHTDAINDLLNRIPESRRGDVVLLDPTDEEYSFGINLLHCRDPKNGIELDHAFGRVRGIFEKVWGDDRGQLGVWLDKIIRNTVYLLLENPGYTLYDLPPLLWEDATLRNELLRNVKVKTGVKDFWYKEFDRLTKRERTEQVEPTLSRLDIFRNNTMVRDIVSQTESTIDFGNILKERKIVLLRLPTNLASDGKHLIGTIVLNEVLYAVFERDKLAKAERTYFGIYCDEFQEFVTPDFARLFTQSGKYKVMPVVAHQTRLGQFKPGDPNQGATLTSPNKVLFTLSSADARELALEFAEEPPTETRFEEQLVISDEPVRELLRGRHKPEIQEFIDKYLRYLQWKREDMRDDMEDAKFARMIELDTAAIFGAEAQEEGIAGPTHYSEQVAAVSARQVALVRARMHSINLVALHEKSNRLRVTMRELNSFLIEIMEGKKRVGEEAFSDFLIALAAGYSALPEAYAETLGLYIKLSYGDPGKHRAIPFDLARSHRLFFQEVGALIFHAEKKTEEERRKFQSSYIIEEEQKRARWRKWKRESESWDRLRAMEERIISMHYRLGNIRGGMTGTLGNMIRQENFIWYPANVYTWFMWLRLFPDIERLVIPYRTAKFNKTWKCLMADHQAAKTIAKIAGSLELVERWKFGFQAYMEYMRARVARDLKEFLHRYQEGALVMLALLDCAGKSGWRTSRNTDDISLSEFPGIEGKDPVKVWCLVERLRVLMREVLGEGECKREFSSVFSQYLQFHKELGYSYIDEELFWAGFQTTVSWSSVYDGIRHRKDVKSLETLLTEQWGFFVRHHSTAGELWKKISEPIRYYLLCRAADLLSFGDKYSSLPQASFPPYEELVSALVWLSKDTKARLDEAEEKEQAAKERKVIEEECAKKVKEISYGPPAILAARVLDALQIRTVRNACIEEIKQGPQVVSDVAATIDEFVSFCCILAKPENHMRIKGQHVEKKVKTRTEIDMVNEMARVLTALPRYTAYAKVVEEKGGEQGNWKGKIRTAKLADMQEDKAAETRRSVLARREDYCRPRGHIQEEIKRREREWRGPQAQAEEPSGRREEEKPQTRERVVSAQEESPPPVRAVTQSAEGARQESKTDDARKE